jgi:hypothetical protein
MDGLDVAAYKDASIPTSLKIVSSDSDFNGDGKSDVVLRNDDGTIEYRTMDGMNVTSYKDEALSQVWNVVDPHAFG